MKKFLPFCFILQLGVVGLFGASSVFAGTFEAKEAELKAARNSRTSMVKIQKLEYELFYERLKQEYSRCTNQELESIDKVVRVRYQASKYILNPYDDFRHMAELSKIRSAAKFTLSRVREAYLEELAVKEVPTEELAATFTNPYLEDVGFRLGLLGVLYNRNSHVGLQSFRQSDLFFSKSSEVTHWRRSHPESGIAKVLPQIIKGAIQEYLDENLMSMSADEGKDIDIRAHLFAGSSRNDTLYPAEGMIHYLKLVEDIPEDGPGYFHYKVLAFFENYPTPYVIHSAGLHTLTQLVRNKFAEGKKTITVVLRLQEHYVTLVIQQTGRVIIVDSHLGQSYTLPKHVEAVEKIIASLNAGLGPSSTKKFEKVDFINVAQQSQTNKDSLFFAILNAHQIAKIGRISGYGDVSHVLRCKPFKDDGSQDVYDYIHKMDSLHSSLHGDCATEVYFSRILPAESYSGLMQALRKKTQEYILKKEHQEGMDVVLKELLENARETERKTVVKETVNDMISKVVEADLANRKEVKNVLDDTISRVVAHVELRKIGERVSDLRIYANEVIAKLKSKVIIFENLKSIAHQMIDEAVALAEQLKYNECTREDQPAVLARALQDCDLSKKAEPQTREDYLACIDFVMPKFLNLKTDSCISVFVPKVNETLKKNLLQHIEKAKIFSEGKESAEFKDVFQHLESWAKNVSLGLYKNEKVLQVMLSEMGETEVNFLEEYKQIVNALWNHYVQQSESRRAILKAAPTFSDGLNDFAMLLEGAVSHQVDPEIFYLLMNRGLSEVHQRMTFFAGLNDFVTEMLGNRNGSSNRSEISILIDALARLDDPYECARSWKQNPFAVDNPEIQRWVKAMMAAPLYDRQLTEEIGKIQGVELSRFSEIPLDWFPEYAQNYASFIQEWVIRANSFRDTGLLNGLRLPTLSFGLTEKLIENVLPRSAARIKQLEEAAAATERTRAEVAQKELQAGDHEIRQRQLDANLEFEKQNLSNLSSDLAAHQSALIDVAQSQTNRMLGWVGLSHQSHWRDSGKTVTLRTGVGKLSAADARYEPSQRIRRIDEVAISDQGGLGSFELGKGQVLRIAAKGKWAPTCALKKEGINIRAFAGPEGYALVTGTSRSVVTSVDQYESMKEYVDSSESSYHDKSYGTVTTDSVLAQFSHQTEDSASESTQEIQSYQRGRTWAVTHQHLHEEGSMKTEREPSYSVKRSGRPVVFQGKILYPKIKVQVNRTSTTHDSDATIGATSDIGHNTTDWQTATGTRKTVSDSQRETHDHLVSSSTNNVNGTRTQRNEGTVKDRGTQSKSQDSNETRMSASFEMGYKSSFTPFPDLPTGSLLLVRMPKGNINLASAIDIQVLRGEIVVIGSQDEEIYLVVNDCRGSDSNSISIDYNIEELQSDQGQRALKDAEEAIQQLHQDGQVYLKAGSLSSFEAEALKGAARARLSNQSGINVAQLEFFHELWESWLASEIVQLEHRVKIVQIERQLLHTVRNIKKVQGDLGTLKKAKGLNEVMQSWNQEQYDLFKLGSEISQTMRFLKDRMLPVLRIRYPGVLENLGWEQRETLSNIKLNASMMDVTRLLRTLYDSIQHKLEGAIDEVNTQEHPVLIRFPRPDLHPDYNAEEAEANKVPYVPYFASLEAWQGLEAVLFNGRRAVDTSIRLLIEPEDLYAKGYIRVGALPRTAAAPIVEGMFLVLQTDETVENETIDRLNEIPILVDMDLDSELLFPNENARDGDRFFVAGDWAQTVIPVIFTNKVNPLSTLADIRSRRSGLSFGTGLSPFGTFNVKLGQIDFADGHYASIARSVKDMFLVFNTKSRSVGGRLHWLNNK